MNRGRATVKAPCKLNLYLDILGRRDDGYHDICTVMQTVSLYNTVSISPSKEGVTIKADMPGVPAGEGNTAYKAALAFSRRAGIKPAWLIELDKAVPFEAGMGSASADAAGALAGLNALHGHPLGEAELLLAAGEVGADVPFLLMGGAALCEGIGDKMTRLKNADGLYFVVAKGRMGFSTAEIYRRFDSRTTPGIFLEDGILKAIEAERPGRIAKNMANRFEYCLHDTSVAEYKALFLRLGALGAAMTGSGSAVFGAFVSEPLAHAAADSFKSKALSLFGEEPYLAIARPVSNGPLVELSRIEETL